MELITWFIDFILHLDQHLIELIADYHYWIYAILFLIIFCETGVVVTPILPGDSLLFALGALAAVDDTGTLNAPALWVLLMVAAWLGDATNYRIGKAVGPRAFSGNIRWLKKEYLDRTHAFYEKYGGKTIIIARFVPIIRTFAPFVAGIGQMRYRRFFLFYAVGAVLWVGLFIPLGYFFGNLPYVKKRFGLVILAIIVLSILPAAIEFFREWRAKRVAASAPSEA